MELIKRFLDKIFNFYQKQSEIIIPVFFLIFMLLINVPNLMYQYQWELNGSSYFYWGFILPLGVGLMLIFMIRYMNLDYEKKVVITVLILGLILASVSPVNNGWDESPHFFKTLATIDGKGLNADDYNYPISESFYLLKENRINFMNCFDNALNGDWSKETILSNRILDGTAQVTYPVWGYLFCIIGVLIAKKLSLSVGMIYLLGRICNLFGFCLMAYWALKTTPRYKSIFALFMMIPSTLIVASSFSCDGVVYGLVMILVAYFIKWKEEQKVSRKEFFIWSVLIILLGPLKYPYIVLLGLLFLLPQKRFSFSHVNYYKAATVLITLSASILWLIFVSAQFTEFRVDNFDTVRQIRFMMNEPFKALGIFISSINTEFPDYFEKIFRVSFEDGVNVPGITSTLFLFFSGYALYNSGKGLKLSHYEKTWLGVMIVSIWLIMDLTLYLSFAPVAFLKPYGMQGRYLTPLLLLIAMIMPHKENNRENQILSLSVTFIAVVIMTMSYYFYFR